MPSITAEKYRGPGPGAESLGKRVGQEGNNKELKNISLSRSLKGLFQERGRVKIAGG